MGGSSCDMWMENVGISQPNFLKVVSFLGPSSPESFTGHGMRRSSATLLVDAGGDITTLKRYGGWKSSTEAESYIEDSLCNKMAIAEKIQVLPKDRKVGLSSSSDTPNQVDSKTPDQNKFVFDINVNVNNNSK